MNARDERKVPEGGGEPGLVFLAAGVLVVVAVAGAFAFYLYSRMTGS